MRIYESAENYLETIFILSKKNIQVRSIDVANEMGFSRPSVSVAMKQFRENGLVNVDDDGGITLTENGLSIAEEIYERHRLLTEILVSLGVSESTAQEDACKIEHDLSQESFDCIRKYYLESK